MLIASAPIKLRTYLRTQVAENPTKYHFYKNLFKLSWKNLGSYTRVFTVAAMEELIKGNFGKRDQ